MEVGVLGVGVSSVYIQQQTPTVLYKGPEKINFEFGGRGGETGGI